MNGSEHFTRNRPVMLVQFGEVLAVGTEESLNVFDLIGAFQKIRWIGTD